MYSSLHTGRELRKTCRFYGPSAEPAQPAPAASGGRRSQQERRFPLVFAAVPALVTSAMSGAPPRCKCEMPARQLVTKKAGPNQGRAFWTCAATDGQGCNFFAWAAGPPAAATTQPAPAKRPFAPQQPERVDGQCKSCRAPVMHQRVSASNTKGNAGRLYYSCPACNRYEFITPLPSQPTPAGLNFFAITDPQTLQSLQALLAVPSGVQLGVGRDYNESGRHVSDYDFLEVVNAWRVLNKSKQARYQAFRQGLSSRTPTVLRDAHMAAAAALRQSPAMQMGAARAEANEVLLLHGTKPQHLYSLLFEGLDPQVASNGAQPPKASATAPCPSSAPAHAFLPA